MKRAKSELFKYSNISTDHLSLFAWSHAFIYMFRLYVYTYLYCIATSSNAAYQSHTTHHQRQHRLPVTHHPPPTFNANTAHLCRTPLLRPPATKHLAATVPCHKQNRPKRHHLTSFGPSVSFFYVHSIVFIKTN
jgi:hypothetical protein